MKKSTLEALIDTLNPSGHVLQIGFGEEADLIQAHHPKTHVIIASDPNQMKQAKSWISHHPSVKLIPDSWQTSLPKLGRYDLIYFHSPIQNELQSQVAQGMHTVFESKKLLKEIEKVIPHIAKTRYSDANIDHLCKTVGKTEPKQLYRFMNDLKKNGQITAKQYDHAVQKYNIKPGEPTHILIEDPLFPFINSCIHSHLHKGSKIACITSDRLSRYDNPQFFERIISNSTLDYKEVPLPVLGKEVLALSITVL